MSTETPQKPTHPWQIKGVIRAWLASSSPTRA
ncbi:hypothetical protein ABH924_003331 [Arthrobacter sp. GAS37]